MNKKNTTSIITRYKYNPILTKDDVPYLVTTVHNAAVVKYNDQYVMLFRSHQHNGRSIIGIADSMDGFEFNVRSEPFLIPTKTGKFSEYEEFGVEDPRISQIDKVFYITYSAYSNHGVRIGLAKTVNFTDVERISLITEPDTRNLVLFPEKIGGSYVRLDRPHTKITPWAI